MTIDKSGEWWIGNNPQDIQEYLVSFSEDEYPITDFRLCKCKCGSEVFQLEADDTEGAARRQCVSCGIDQFICDCKEHWEDTDPETLHCVECNSIQTNVGVGFARYQDKSDGIQWIYVGCRCTNCGILGCFTSWKVGYEPSLHLIDEV
ncbi:hypothetical protein [Leptospira alstonii]|uniref:Uncharacterized protein n=2 Tax=Leptospira alstonii TaxID=28452 RepID=M6CY60_9LEPT|nr:hypothetical protein [Leptospira alstonii]EMJ93878.1 hypothetical protein LEP1GSC194_2919 [Leptospira alstonii serovar Sichuan str. 79601]EQA80325.1 hypothetical protein LEP1GSC193_4438 [Leptospira alstonii serovar Pingchang str. 80-412]